MKRIRQEENGQVLVMTALSLVLLLGLLALAVDMGLLFHSKRVVQNAADSAAIAGALEEEYNGTANVVTKADAAAANNGITNASEVTVNTSPTDGYHTGSGFVEVVIRHPSPTVFMRFFGHSMITVTGRAVAGLTPSPACLYVLDPSDAGTLYLKGNATITAPNCGIQVDSSSQEATCNQGAAKTYAPYMRIAGGQDVGGKCKATPDTKVITGAQPTGDPFNNLTGPIPPGDCTTTNVGLDSSGVLSGTISGPGAGKAACYSFTTTSGHGKKATSTSSPVELKDVKLGPGIYVFETGVNLSGTVTVNSGTLDIEQGTFTQGNAQLSITAPDSGTYQGIALMQPSTNTTASNCDTSVPCLQVQFGSGNETLNGLIYAPTSEVYMQDEGGGVQSSGVIAWQLYINSKLTFTDSYSHANPNASPLSQVSLVE